MLSRGLTWGNKNIQRGVRENRERLKIGKDFKKEEAETVWYARATKQRSRISRHSISSGIFLLMTSQILCRIRFDKKVNMIFEVE